MNTLKLKIKNLFVITIASSITVPSLTVAAQKSDSGFNSAIKSALRFGQENANTYGQIKFNLRYRYEYADTDNTAPKPANANTFRLRLGYLTPEIAGIQGFAEY